MIIKLTGVGSRSQINADNMIALLHCLCIKYKPKMTTTSLKSGNYKTAKSKPRNV